MDPQWIQSVVEKVMYELENSEQSTPGGIPIAVSARHVHLSEKDVATLFGPSYQLTKKSELSQPNQFAAEETVTLAGPRGSIERVRVLGPSRKFTQVEISQTDAFKLGVKPPIRQSGDITGSSPITIIGPKGSIYLSEGLIIAQAHIHMSPEDAARLKVENGQLVQVITGSERPITYGRVLVRVSPSYRLEMHIDTDEGNAGFIQKGQTGELAVEGQSAAVTASFSPTPAVKEKKQRERFEGKLLTQHDVQDLAETVIQIQKRTIITPLAKDKLKELGKKVEIID